MSQILLKDITVELVNQDDCFLTEIFHLILEISSNGIVAGKINLLSRDSVPGVWDANEIPALIGLVGEFMISIWMELDESERQLLGFMELSGRELYDAIGNQYEVPLMCHESYPSLILKTQVVVMENGQETKSSTEQQSAPLYDDGTVKNMLGDALAAREDFERHGNMASLERAISQLETASKVIHKNEIALPATLSGLGSCLARRFEQLGRVSDINDAVAHFELAVNLTPDGHFGKAECLNHLGTSLKSRFQRLGNLNDLHVAITRQQAAVDLVPDHHPEKPTYLSNLGSSLVTRFQWLRNLEDLHIAVSRQQAAVDLTPNGHPEKPGRLNNLANSLGIRFERLQDVDDINDAILRQKDAVELTSSDSPYKSMFLNNLGNCLQIRFRRFGHLDDIVDAISRREEAIKLMPDSHPDKPSYLANLGTSLEARFERVGNIDDLNDAISRLQTAVDLSPDGHPDKILCLNGLASCLQSRFEALGNIDDIINSISRKEETLKLMPDDHPQKPNHLNNLGYSLFRRFERLGDIGDIDNAISQQQTAVDLTPDGHTEKPSRLNNLGNSLKARYDRFGFLDDLNSSISRHQAAVELTPDDHPSQPGHLNNLGSSLRCRFQQLGNVSDIDDAISRQQVAINLTPNGHTEKPGLLANLGGLFHARFRRFGNINDLHEAISREQAAIDLTPDHHPSKPVLLNNLGLSLQTRFGELGNPSDMDDAVSRHQAAVDLTPDGHANQAGYLMNLSTSLVVRFHRLRYTNDAEAAISTFSAAAVSPASAPLHRFNAAQAWAELASILSHPSLLSAYECVINLIPLVAWLGLPIQDRHHQLIKIGGIARDAAAAAISAEQYDKALEWLEQGRSIVWTQILRLRTPVDQLHDIYPDLANQLLHVSRLLDQGSDPGRRLDGDMRSMEEKGRQHRALTTEWESIIEQVRSLPNFENFLRPPSSSDLMKAARDGPVVVLNIAKERCDTLAIIPGFDEVIHIPLPNITSDRITQLQVELKDLLYSSGVRMRGERAAVKVTDEGDSEDCKHILEELWNGLVNPVVNSLAFSPHPDTLPRIWWCPTGPLAFLPIHAAGIYNPDSAEAQLCNYVVSSYTPTLSALLEPSSSATDSSFKLLSVIQPSAPGASSIPNTKEELNNIQRHLANRTHVILEGQEGIKTRVTKEMEDCNWLHLACHGVQMPEEPTKSALILEDGHLTLEEIIKLNLPKAELAFLSACQTTAGDENLSEEAVHIAGGMSLAGYRGVVATMWSIRDDLAPEVADAFYGHIMRDGERPNSRKAAEALHLSVQKLRKKAGVSLVDWIPFVHLGI